MKTLNKFLEKAFIRCFFQLDQSKNLIIVSSYTLIMRSEIKILVIIKIF